MAPVLTLLELIAASKSVYSSVKMLNSMGRFKILNNNSFEAWDEEEDLEKTQI